MTEGVRGFVRDSASEKMMREMSGGTCTPHVYRCGRLIAMVGQEHVQESGEPEDLRWHLSVSHPFRHPTWDEISDARHALLPEDVVLCVPFPPRAWWVSIHQHCFHLWEIRDANLTAQWKFDGEGAARVGGNVSIREARG